MTSNDYPDGFPSRPAMSDLDLDAEVYRAVDDLAGVRQRAILARKLALIGHIGPITAERFARDLEELAAAVERLKALVQAEHDQERKRIVAALRDEGIKNLGYPADAGELLRETADAIERGEIDGLAAGDE